ncbi:MAG: ATP-dependent 6-phosphofructokinase [Actinobacteria bacterium]|nr:ATP-dependent 6-phosphofructokinase [Actinomycetota bacterium]
MSGVKKAALLTGGGDSSAINDFIRSLVIMLQREDIGILGIRNSYKGLIENRIMALDTGTVDTLCGSGGTIVGTSRTNPYKIEGAVEKILKTIESNHIDVLVCAGGNDTLTVASKLKEEGVNTIGIPQTIDNDILGTDYSIGFHSAVKNIVECTRMMISSNIAHDKEMLVEVMGRESGFLAVRSAVILGAGGALIPEFPVDVDALCEQIKRKRRAGRKHGLFMVSEGIKLEGGQLLADEVDVFGNVKLGGIVYGLADIIDRKIGVKPRVNVLGYTQRGGEADQYDSYLSNIFALGVTENINNGIFGHMVGVVNEKPSNIPLADAIAQIKVVDRDTYEFANSMGDIW